MLWWNIETYIDSPKYYSSFYSTSSRFTPDSGEHSKDETLFVTLELQVSLRGGYY